ncbi:MAG: hypothetical protein ABL860_07255 [Candidatus Nitrotoga sp.]
MMQRLNLDLVKSQTPVWPGMLVLVIAIVGTLFSYGQYFVINERSAAMESELAQVNMTRQRSHAANRTATLSSAELETEGRRAREVASLLLLPWRDLFSALESASQNNVALLAIEPDYKKHQVRITAEAKDFDILIRYLKRLGDTPQLKFVRLLRYEVRENDAQHPLRFTIEASWRLKS